MTVVLHPVDLHGLAAALADVPPHVTLLPLSESTVAPEHDTAVVVAPADDRELQALLPLLAARGEPALVLLGGPELLRVHDRIEAPRIGAGEILLEGDGPGVCVLACGAQVGEALSAAMDLQTQGICPRIVSLTSLKPLDGDLVRRCAEGATDLLVVEPPLPEGVAGLGAAVAAALPPGAAEKMTVLRDRRAPIPDGDEALVHPFGPTARDIRIAVTRLAKA